MRGLRTKPRAIGIVRCLRVRTNRYSVPLPSGTEVEARVHAPQLSYVTEASALPGMNEAI